MARALEEGTGIVETKSGPDRTESQGKKLNINNQKVSEQTRALGAKPEEIKASEEQKWNSVKRVSKS